MDINNLKPDQVNVLNSRPPEGSKVTSSMTMEAVVDATPQPLIVLRPFVQAVNRIPATLPAEAHAVLQALLACFEKQKCVSEGLIGDLIWGFAQANIAKECTYNGLRQLAKEGYIKFQAKDNSWVNMDDDKADSAWVRYQPKLLELVYV
jgi:hypothetical protein